MILKICILHIARFPNFEIKARCYPHSSASLPIARQGCSSTCVSSRSSLLCKRLSSHFVLTFLPPILFPSLSLEAGWPWTVYAVTDDLGHSYFPGSGIIAVHHHPQSMRHWGLNPALLVYWAHILPAELHSSSLYKESSIMWIGIFFILENITKKLHYLFLNEI